MALVKDTVIVLKSINFSEADKILTVFGRNFGKYTLFAKGVRKLESKNRGNIQTFSVSRVSFYEGRNMGTLRESELVKMKEEWGKNIENLTRVLYILNKLLPEGEPEDKLFEKVVGLFDGDLDAVAVNRFRIWMLRELGYLGDFKVCSNCGRSEGLDYVDGTTFAILCEECAGELRSGSVNESIYLISEMKYGSGAMTRSLDMYVKRVAEG